MDIVPLNTFMNCSKLKAVAFSEGTKTIDDVFYGCKKLTTVYIPSSARFEHTLFRSAKKVTIRCKKGSFAEKTAQDYGLKYSIVDE